MNILEELAAYARVRVEEAKKRLPLPEIRRLAEGERKGDFAFENALKKEGISFICECKKASPSKGVIAGEYDYLSIAREYEVAGADCISVLTEPKWFLGSGEHLKEITKAVHTPCIRKDFTVDEYMIYEAKLWGAAAVLLIVAITDKRQLADYLALCDGLGLSSLVETHDEKEAETALSAGARMVGVNNRNLKDFSVDARNSIRLRSVVPKGVLFVAESGVKCAEDVARLKEAGADAVLVGEALMRARDKRAAIRALRGGI